MKWKVGDLIRYENDKRGTYGIAIIVDTYGYDNFDVNWLVAKGFEVNKDTSTGYMMSHIHYGWSKIS